MPAADKARIKAAFALQGKAPRSWDISVKAQHYAYLVLWKFSVEADRVAGRALIPERQAVGSKERQRLDEWRRRQPGHYFDAVISYAIGDVDRWIAREKAEKAVARAAQLSCRDAFGRFKCSDACGLRPRKPTKSCGRR
jgi:hypothetical protein